MHPTTSGAKVYPPERSINPKVSSMAGSTQQAPSRPSSAAPKVKADNDRAKTPSGVEDLNISEGQGSSPNDVFRGLPANIGITLDQFNALNQAARGHPGAGPNQGFIPHPGFYNAGMNVGSQQGFAPSPQMQFYPPNFNPNVYGTPNANSARPGSALPKFQNADSKFSPNQLGHSNGSQQLQSNMARRQSSYFVAPMSPVQSLGPRGWMPSNPAMLAAPMAMQNGAGSMQNPALYQPTMMAANASPALLTPPGTVQAGYPPAYPPGTVSTANFGYPTPPEGAVISPDIPPPVPSVYPDPAYSNINNCIYNPKGTTNVYIRGLRPETTDDDLLHMVRQYGNIVSTKAIIDTQTKTCKGCASSVDDLTYHQVWVCEV
jgi:hypothetical protein